MEPTDITNLRVATMATEIPEPQRMPVVDLRFVRDFVVLAQAGSFGRCRRFSIVIYPGAACTGAITTAGGKRKGRSRSGDATLEPTA